MARRMHEGDGEPDPFDESVKDRHTDSPKEGRTDSSADQTRIEIWSPLTIRFRADPLDVTLFDVPIDVLLDVFQNLAFESCK